MKRLALSPHVFSRFRKLEGTFKGSIFLDAGLDVRLECPNIVIGILQPDRYDKSVNCYVEIKKNKTSLLFEDVASAITGAEFIVSSRSDNDAYVDQCIKFCIQAKDALEEWPPSWFLGASDRSIKKMAQHLPQLAQTARLEHQKVWSEMIAATERYGN